jgi:hypothetical protein
LFSNEDSMQAAIHSRPDLVLSGIPEINPQFCPDAPGLLSLGREISLSSGPIDNLFIDVNAVLTFVECKRYSDNRIKREVYPQALNYASDLQNLLANYNREEFHAARKVVVTGISKKCSRSWERTRSWKERTQRSGVDSS